MAASPGACWASSIAPSRIATACGQRCQMHRGQGASPPRYWNCERRREQRFAEPACRPERPALAAGSPRSGPQCADRARAARAGSRRSTFFRPLLDFPAQAPRGRGSRQGPDATGRQHHGGAACLKRRVPPPMTRQNPLAAPARRASSRLFSRVAVAVAAPVAPGIGCLDLVAATTCWSRRPRPRCPRGPHGADRAPHRRRLRRYRTGVWRGRMLRIEASARYRHHARACHLQQCPPQRLAPGPVTVPSTVPILAPPRST